MKTVGGLLGVVLLTTSACHLPYRPPRPDQPHAILKVRRVYQGGAGTALNEQAYINDSPLLDEARSRDEIEPQHTDAILIHPQRAQFRFANQFLHHETRLVTESYTQRVPYSSTESYSCGTLKYPQTCTRPVTQYRSEFRTRNVLRSVPVIDASCRGTFEIIPEVGHVYLAQYTYRDNGVCTWTCHEQIQADDGQIRQEQCPVPTAKVGR